MESNPHTCSGGICEVCKLRRNIAQLEQQLAEVLKFLKRCSEGYRIVSSGDLNEWQIAEAQARKLFYIEPGGGLGWALLPWSLTTANDEQRIRESQRIAQLAEALEAIKARALGNGPGAAVCVTPQMLGKIAAEALRQLNEIGGGE